MKTSMPKNYYQQIRRRYICSVAAVLTVLACLLSWDLAQDYRLVISSAEKRSASYASALKEHAERVFADNDNDLQNLVEEIRDNGGFPYTRGRQFQKHISSMAKSGALSSEFFVVDKNGNMAAQSFASVAKAVNVAERDFFIHHRDNHDSVLYISRPFKSRITNSWLLSLSRPLRDADGRFMGAVGVALEVGYFEKFYKTIDVGRDGRIILATTGADILVSEPFSEKVLSLHLKQSPLFTTHIPAASVGTIQLDKSLITSDPRIVSYSKLADFPVVSLVSLGRAEVVAPWVDKLYMQGAIASLLYVFALVISFFFIRQMRRLEHASRQLEAKQEELVEKSEQIIAASDEWRGTFDALEDLVLLLDMDRRVIRANKATQALYGKSPKEVIGLQCCQLTRNVTLHPEECPFELMLKSGARASVQLLLGHRWFEVSIDPVFAESGEIIKAVFIAKDIDGIKKAELREHVRSEILELVNNGEPLPQLLEFIAVAIEKMLPEALCSIMMVSEDGTRLVNGAAPSLPDFYCRAVNRTRIGEGNGSCGTAAFRKERMVVEDFSTHPFWKEFTPAQEAGLRSCWSEPVISADGELLGTFAVYHRRPMILGEEDVRLIEQGSVFAGIALERSRNEAERAGLELQLGQSQKMEAIGHLAGGVAHDFNNLLTPIIIYAELIKRALTKDEKLLPKVEGIINASHKARELTQQLLGFGRKQVMQMQIIDLNEVVSGFHSIIRRSLRESIDINLQLSTSPAVIRADRSKIEQILLNLAINAQDAIAGTGQVTLETGHAMIDDEYSRRHPGLEAGPHVMLSFTDSGCGMSAGTLRNIFEPFFTTKQVGHGTGLGLASVYGIVKQHKGYIAARSEVGVGTVFTVYFPLSDEKPASAAPDAELPVVDQGGNETLLLVEDDEMVRTMAAGLLKGLGYLVYVADHPEQALEIVRQHPEKIDLLITDVVMPAMNGLQLFERINAERPDIDRVLYMSGYTGDVIVAAGVMDEGTWFLPKPFSVDALVAKIRESLLPVESSADESTSGPVW